jgi:hypothetical protein
MLYTHVYTVKCDMSVTAVANSTVHTLLAEVDKVTLKSNGNEALSDESLLKSNGDEASNVKAKTTSFLALLWSRKIQK